RTLPEAVSDAVDGLNGFGVLGMMLQLLPQPADMDVDRAATSCVLVLPKLLQEVVPLKDAPRIAGEEVQEVKLPRRKLHALAVNLDRPLFQVEPEPPVLDELARHHCVGHPAQNGPHSRKKLPRAEGF